MSHKCKQIQWDPANGLWRLWRTFYNRLVRRGLCRKLEVYSPLFCYVIFLFTYFIAFLLLNYIYNCTTITTKKFYSISNPNLQCIPTPPSPCLIWKPCFSESVGQYLFCQELHCVLFLKIPHVSDSIWWWGITVWLTSLSMIISGSIHVAVNGIISFLLMAESYSIVYMYIFLIHSSVNGHLGCFLVLTIVYSAAMNTRVHVSFQVMVFSG